MPTPEIEKFIEVQLNKSLIELENKLLFFVLPLQKLRPKDRQEYQTLRRMTSELHEALVNYRKVINQKIEL